MSFSRNALSARRDGGLVHYAESREENNELAYKAPRSWESIPLSSFETDG